MLIPRPDGDYRTLCQRFGMHTERDGLGLNETGTIHLQEKLLRFAGWHVDRGYAILYIEDVVRLLGGADEIPDIFRQQIGKSYMILVAYQRQWDMAIEKKYLRRRLHYILSLLDEHLDD